MQKNVYKNILIQPIVRYQWTSNVVKIVNSHYDITLKNRQHSSPQKAIVVAYHNKCGRLAKGPTTHA